MKLDKEKKRRCKTEGPAQAKVQSCRTRSLIDVEMQPPQEQLNSTGLKRKPGVCFGEFYHICHSGEGGMSGLYMQEIPGDYRDSTREYTVNFLFWRDLSWSKDKYEL